MSSERINGDAWTTTPDGSTSLVASVCNQCGRLDFPPLDRCPTCWSEALDRKSLSMVGSLYTFSVVYSRHTGYPSPYVAGYVDFPEGLRAFGLINTDPSLVTIGMRVRTAQFTLVDQDGATLGHTYCFEPAEEGVR